METEDAFVGDADVDVRLHDAHRAPTTTTTTSTGSTTFTTHGDIAKSTSDLHVHEASPLLGEGSDRSGPDVGLDDDQGNGPTPWDDLADEPWWRRPSIWWLLPCLLLFTLGFGGIAVPKINLILNLVCRDYFADRAAADPAFTYLPVLFDGDNAQCRIPEVQSLVARFQLYLQLIPGILSALVSPRIGHLSDRNGRTRLMAVTATGAVLSELVTVFVAAYPERTSVYVLLLSAVFDGLGGSFTTMMALVHSYASDCSPPERRNVAFGYFHGALFSGIALGPSLAAFVIKKAGETLPVFFIALSFHSFYLFMIVFFIPESLSKARQRIARERHQTQLALAKNGPKWYTWSQLNPLNLLTPLSILNPPIGKPSVLVPTRRGATPALRRNIILLAAIDTAMFGVAMGTIQVIIIYAEYMFGWGNVESSIFVSIVNSSRVVNLFVVLPIATRIFRGRVNARAEQQQQQQHEQPHVNTGSDMLDITIIRLSIFLDLLGYIGYASSKHGSVMVLSGVVASLGGMGSPTLQSSLTKHVPRDRVGQILGAMGLLHALARVCAPTIFNLIYSVTVKRFPQTVFVCLASVFGLTLCLSFFIKPHVLREDPSSATSADEDGDVNDDTLPPYRDE